MIIIISMKKIIICITILFLHFQILFSRQNFTTNVLQYQIKDKSENLKEVEEYLKKRQEVLEQLKKKKEPESSLRRFEIQFFSSGAMVYFSTYIFVKLFSEIYSSASSELSAANWYFIIVNSIGIGTYIAIKDYYDVKKIKMEEEKNYGNIDQSYYRFSFLSKRF